MTDVTKRTDFYDPATNSIEWIDLETWKRKDLFAFYQGTDFPYIVLTTNVDVTRPLAFAREHGVSFNLVMVYLCTKIMDEIPNYRYRFIEDKPFLIHHTRAMVNHLKPGEELFCVGEAPYPCDDIVEFCKKTHENQMNAKSGNIQEILGGKLDVVNFTSVPWISYTGFIRTIMHGGVDNAPKISFGKYFEDPAHPGHTLLPVSNQTHHGLMDGTHVGQFFEKLQKACDEL